MDKSKYLARVGLVFGGMLFGLIILELFSRYFLEKTVVQSAIRDWKDTDENFINYFQLSYDTGFEPIYEKPINRRLSQELSKDRILGVTSDTYKRIVIIGDSITHRGAFPKLLQNMLDNKRSGKSFEVVSYGVESYNTAQEAAYIQSHWSTLNPDMLILQFALNDFEYSPVVVKINGRITYLSAKKEPVYEPMDALFQASSLYRFIRYKTLLGETKFDENDWERKTNTVRTTLINIKQLSATYRTPFIVVIFPFFEDQQPESEYSSILSLLKEISVSYINLLPILESHGNLSSFASSENGVMDKVHPNEKSQQIVAAAIYKYFDQLGIFGSNTSSD